MSHRAMRWPRGGERASQLNISRYLDAYQQYSTPGGERYPEAQEELRNGCRRALCW